MNKTLIQWKTIHTEWNKRNFASVKFSLLPFSVKVQEYYNSKLVFEFERFFEGRRNTTVFSNLVGLTLCNLDSQKDIYVTEGVSDFAALKMLLPYENVVGHTNLKWATRDIKYLQYFRKVFYVTDKDQAGLSAISQYHSAFNGNLHILLPYGSASKDVAHDFMLTTITPAITDYVIKHYKS